MRNIPLLVLCLLPLTSMAGGIRVQEIPDLPEPVSNNAVALLPGEDGVTLLSLQGLSAGKEHSDVHHQVWILKPGAEQWQALQDVPVRQGRLAGVAVTAANTAWLFGGYTVAPDGAEVSTPEVFRFDAAGDQLAHVTDMPVPVDDMTAFVYRNRFIYLVSGWHDLGNVNLVQVLDTQTLNWSQATPFPGAAVFGHAGGMYGDKMLVCDGVKIEYPEDGSPRRFVISDECWLGMVDEDDHRRIRWQPIPAHPGPARYRMGAAADNRGRIVFSGGTDNPYNYDGIGYNSVPSEPQKSIFRFDLWSGSWESDWSWRDASMDHRGMLYHDGWFYLLGGMLAGQEVTGRVVRFKLSRQPHTE